MWFDREGRPIGVRRYVQLARDPAYRRVGLTDVGDVRVSTVWLGLDHRFGPGPVPLIFETMVFGGDLDGYQERYGSAVAALAGHDQWVARVRASRKARH